MHRFFARLRPAAVIGFAAVAAAATAQIPGPAPAPVAAPPPQVDRGVLATRFPGLRPDQVVPAPVAGLYEVRLGPKIAYLSADGRYLVQGEIIDIQTQDNLTEQRRESARLDALKAIPESSMVIFSGARVKHTITVFTDIDCGYCRKLHQQIADYNARGIRVRYVAFPRSGPATDSWRKAEQVWCSKDRRDALTRAKGGQVLKQKECQPNPVAQEYQLGRDFGLQGTPAIITDRGEMIGGYLDPAELEKYLDTAKTAGRSGG